MAESARTPHPFAFSFRVVDAGCLTSSSGGRTGRRTSSPPQFGQMPFRRVSEQSAQNVHS
jgi:hypothetical protein